MKIIVLILNSWCRPDNAGWDCVTLDGDQISGKGVMVGGYVNPSHLYISKYLLYTEAAATAANIRRERDDLESQVVNVESGMCPLV